MLQELYQSAQHISEKRKGSGAEAGSGRLTNGSGSGRPKNADPADSDPVPDFQHRYTGTVLTLSSRLNSGLLGRLCSLLALCPAARRALFAA
jgi:hypothetical protein